MPSQHPPLVPQPHNGPLQIVTLGLLKYDEHIPIATLIHFKPLTIGPSISFHPGFRLRWCAFPTCSMDRAALAHFLGLALRESGHVVAPHKLDLDIDAANQMHYFCIALFDLEHALARDVVLDPEIIAYVGQYIHGRHILCGPVRYMPGPSQKTEDEILAIIRCGQGQRSLETPIRLLNHLFEARWRLRTAADDCKIESSALSLCKIRWPWIIIF